MFKVFRTTLQKLAARFVTRRTCKYEVRAKASNAEMETQLVDYLLIIENQFYGLTRSDERKMAYYHMAQLVIRNNLKHF